MIEIRSAAGRGTTNLGWLDSRHTFAFGRGFPADGEPHAMGFRGLRVINDDRIAAGAGFQTHPHDNMEILSYVLEGGLEHKDSMGTVQTIRPGDFQLTSAGTGITHSEYNPSDEEPGRFIQIWIKPSERDIEPSYAVLTHDAEAARNALRPVASPDGAAGSMRMHADARVYVSELDAGERVSLGLGADRHAWVQVARGTVRVGEHSLVEGDGAAISDESEVTIDATSGAEVLVFDLP
ncbi:MAG: pirin family protein [Planctomycetota bacterium]